jgi:hypothetical protein
MAKMIFASVLLAATAGVAAQQEAVYADPTVPVEARVTDLPGRMTLEEKISALSTNPSVPQLGWWGRVMMRGCMGWRWVAGRMGRAWAAGDHDDYVPQSRGWGRRGIRN